MAANLGAELSQQLLCERTAGNTGRGLASRGAFENIAQIARAKLQSTGKVSMARARTFHAP